MRCKLLSFFQKIFEPLKKSNKLDLIFLLVFIVGLFLPMSKISKSEKSIQENRMLARKPHLFVNNQINEKYGTEFESYFNDRFNGRKKLLRLYSYITEKSNFNGNKDVLKGKNGWLFYRGDHSLENFQNKTLFTQEELQSIGKYLADINKWAENHGKKFYYVVAPDKNRIYGENIPVLQKVRPDTESRQRQLIDFLDKNTSVRTIDLREALLAKKDTGLLYYKEDTHWNELGAYWAYREMVQKMGITPIPYTKLREKFISHRWPSDPKGDLLILLNKKPSDLSVYRKPIIEDSSICRLNNPKPGSIEEDLICTREQPGLKVAMFRDSFAIAPRPYLNNTFRQIRYFWRYNITAEDLDYIDEQADIIILEHLERLAHLLIPLHFPER